MSEPTTYTQADLDRIIGEKVAAATKPFEGIDAAEFRRLKDAEAERLRKEQEAKGNYEKLIADQQAASKTQIDALQAKLDGERVRNALIGEATKQNAISPDQIYALLRDKVRATDTGAVEVIGADSKPEMKNGKAVTLDALVAGFLEANTHFVAAGPGGAGSGEGRGSGGKSTGSEIVLSEAEARDPAKYREARQRATKEGKQLRIERK